MTRGRPPNPRRDDARAFGAKTYIADDLCLECGTSERYTSNASCVACAKARGSARYAAQSPDEREAQRQRDHERYVASKAE